MFTNVFLVFFYKENISQECKFPPLQEKNRPLSFCGKNMERGREKEEKRKRKKKDIRK
jgi:hypothetical protein